MKKWFAFLLALIMCQSLCACGGTANQKDNKEEIATALNAIWMDEAPIPDTSYTVVMSYVFNEDGKMLLETGRKGKLIRHHSASNLSNRASTLSKTGCSPDAIFAFTSPISSLSSLKYFLG